MDCKRCEQLKKANSAVYDSSRKCAFKLGEFHAENWNCGTMQELREIVFDSDIEVYSNDENAAILVAPEKTESTHVFLAWYKHRGKTSMAQEWTIDDVLKPLTLKTAEAVIELYLDGRR